MILQVEIKLPAFGRGVHQITHLIEQALPNLPAEGLLNVFVHHTSAGLMINENADPDVARDLNAMLNKMVPENLPLYTHTLEGPDDMPAHIKSALTGVSLNIPVKNSKLHLGTWQGIFLCEFRNHGGSRRITLTLLYT
ncbi:MAG: YjbQ family protein [Bacteroidia bacterium]|nr:YjbQ family protein [Bacteroidia bacterium]